MEFSQSDVANQNRARKNNLENLNFMKNAFF